jgi:hypothetical protein
VFGCWQYSLWVNLFILLTFYTFDLRVLFHKNNTLCVVGLGCMIIS